MKGCEPRLTLKKRHKSTRKWPSELCKWYTPISNRNSHPGRFSFHLHKRWTNPSLVNGKQSMVPSFPGNCNTTQSTLFPLKILRLQLILVLRMLWSPNGVKPKVQKTIHTHSQTQNLTTNATPRNTPVYPALMVNSTYHHSLQNKWMIISDSSSIE